MLIMARDRSYAELLESVKGKKAHIWTCNTCARLCYELGGRASAEKLATKLRSDGIMVTGISAVPASCMDTSVKKGVVSDDTDVVITLTCDMGSELAGDFIKKELLNPINTFGPGMFTDDDGPVLVTKSEDGKLLKKRLLDLSGTNNPEDIPFV